MRSIGTLCPLNVCTEKKKEVKNDRLLMDFPSDICPQASRQIADICPQASGQSRTFVCKHRTLSGHFVPILRIRWNSARSQADVRYLSAISGWGGRPLCPPTRGFHLSAKCPSGPSCGWHLCGHLADVGMDETDICLEGLGSTTIKSCSLSFWQAHRGALDFCSKPIQQGKMSFDA